MFSIPFPEELPKYAEGTGFSPEVLVEGFRRVWRHLERGQFERLLSAEAPELLRTHGVDFWGSASKTLESRRAACPQCATHRLLLVMASTVPPAAFQDVLISLILPLRVTVRPSGSLVSLMHYLAGHLTRYCAALGERLEVAEPVHGAEAVRGLMAGHDAVCVSGSDETVDLYRSVCPEGVRFTEHGHRISLAAVRRGDISRLTCDDIRRFAEDASIWDQQGCLSPKVLFVEGDMAQARALVRALAEALDDVAERWPGLPPDLSESAHRNMEVRMAAFDGAEIVTAERNRDVLVLFPESVEVRPLLFHRTLAVSCVRDAISAALRFAPQVQAFATPGPLEVNAERRLRGAGFNYFCRFGEMQDPPLDWLHGGVGTLLPLL